MPWPDKEKQIAGVAMQEAMVLSTQVCGQHKGPRNVKQGGTASMYAYGYAPMVMRDSSKPCATASVCAWFGNVAMPTKRPLSPVPISRARVKPYACWRVPYPYFFQLQTRTINQDRAPTHLVTSCAESK